jgi:hypothetical protein
MGIHVMGLNNEVAGIVSPCIAPSLKHSNQRLYQELTSKLKQRSQHWHPTRELRKPAVDSLVDNVLLDTIVRSRDGLCLKRGAVGSIREKVRVAIGIHLLRS